LRVSSQAKTDTLWVEATPTGIGMSYPMLHAPIQLGASPPAAAPFGSALSTWNVVDGPPRRRGAGAEEVFVLQGQSLGRVGELTEASAGLPPQAGDLFGATL